MVAHYAHQVIETTHKDWSPSSAELDVLGQQAERLWPESLPYACENRERWKAAVKKVRSTYGGWVLDQGSAPRTYY